MYAGFASPHIFVAEALSNSRVTSKMPPCLVTTREVTYITVRHVSLRPDLYIARVVEGVAV